MILLPSQIVRRQLVCLFFFTVVFCSSGGNSSIILKIIGGRDSTKGAWPSHTAIFVEKRGYNSTFLCGGVVVHERWVLTSADCIRGYTSLGLIIGAWNLTNRNEDRITTTSNIVHMHPCYKAENLTTNNFAMIRLPNAVRRDYVARVANFTTPDFRFNNINNCIATGFGRIKNRGQAATILQEVTFPTTSAAKCQEVYDESVSEDKLCTYGAQGKDSCNGDAGGPLLCPVPKANGSKEYFVAGILIAGPSPCANPARPSIFQSVQYWYREWIKNIIKQYTIDPSQRNTVILTGVNDEDCSRYRPIIRSLGGDQGLQG